MLPVSISKNVYGISTRSMAPDTQTAKLVGRSRVERMLDKIYNRQSLALRKQAPVPSIPRLKKDEVKKQEIKKEVVQEVTTFITKDVDPVSIIDRLIKSTNSNGKFEKVFKLSHQLVNSSYFDPFLNHFIDLYTALSCSPYITTSPKQRPQIIEVLQKVQKCVQPSADSTNSSRKENQTPLKKLRTLPKGLEKPDTQSQPISITDVPKDEKVSMDKWVYILSLNSYWHNLLFTDDSFKFNQALRQIESALISLPFASFPEKPVIDVYSSLQTYRNNSVKHNIKPDAFTSENNYIDSTEEWVAYEFERQILFNTLKTIQAYGATKWSRSAVTQFFNQVYLNKDKYFYKCDHPLIEDYRNSISQKDVFSDKLKYMIPLAAGEHYHPIRDGRDERIIAVQGAAVWTAKQLGLH